MKLGPIGGPETLISNHLTPRVVTRKTEESFLFNSYKIKRFEVVLLLPPNSSQSQDRNSRTAIKLTRSNTFCTCINLLIPTLNL